MQRRQAPPAARRAPAGGRRAGRGRLVEDARERRQALERLDAAWEDLLFCQFHDILAGTSIPSAWESVRELQGRAADRRPRRCWWRSADAGRRATCRLTPFAQLVVINADETAWTGLVEAEPFLDFAPWGERWLSDPAGRRAALPARPARGPGAHHPRRVPARARAGRGRAGARARRPRAARGAGARRARGLAARAAQRAPGGRARRARRACSALDGRELLGEGGIGLHLRHDASDTWTHDLDRFAEPVAARLRARELGGRGGRAAARARAAGGRARRLARALDADARGGGDPARARAGGPVGGAAHAPAAADRAPSAPDELDERAGRRGSDAAAVAGGVARLRLVATPASSRWSRSTRRA